MLLYNTLARKKQKIPQKPGDTLLFYACGPTVYDDTHIGHMRRYVMDDILKRTLIYIGIKVAHVMNITDVGHLTGDDDSGEDKIEKGSLRMKKSVWNVAKEYESKFWDTLTQLNIDKKQILVMRATDNIDEMIKLISILKNKGFTYETNQAVYFDTRKFKHYGKLSGQKLNEKKLAARNEINIDSEKKNNTDFVLWFKRIGRFANHTMHWNAPWGDGFPGWHIECSAMSMKGLMSHTIDIHTGGIDHIPIHHENEIAQSEAATGKNFVNFWVHHAFLQVNGEKMSKSKNNFYSLNDLNTHISHFDPLAMRYLCLQTHYRKPMNFTWEALESANAKLNDLRSTVAEYRGQSGNNNAKQKTQEFKQKFIDALSDDLNTSVALSVLWEIIKSDLNPNEKLDLILDFDKVFGFGLSNQKKDSPNLEIPKSILHLGQMRQEARERNDFKKADEIRDQIEFKGYFIEDIKDGFKITPF